MTPQETEMLLHTLLHFFELVVELLLLSGQVGYVHCQGAVGLLQL